MTTTLYSELLKEKEEIELDMYCLECGDDYLFSNVNGNLPRYRDMQQRLRDVNQQIKEIEDVEPTQQQQS